MIAPALMPLRGLFFKLKRFGMVFCDDCVNFVKGECKKGYILDFREPVDITDESWGYYVKSCNEFKEAKEMRSDKQIMLDRLLIGNPDDVAKFGAVKPPEGFAIMRLNGMKHDVNAPIFYYIKYTGEYSIPTTRKNVFEWIRENRKHHGE